MSHAGKEHTNIKFNDVVRVTQMQLLSLSVPSVGDNAMFTAPGCSSNCTFDRKRPYSYIGTWNKKQ